MGNPFFRMFHLLLLLIAGCPNCSLVFGLRLLKAYDRKSSQLINFVYYVEGLGHNLFSVGQFCDSDLEVAFRKHTCFIRDLDDVDLIKGSRGSNLYTLCMDNLLLSSPICLLSKASKTKSWLWHRILSHLNFDYITSLAKNGLVRGLPKLKYQSEGSFVLLPVSWAMGFKVIQWRKEKLYLLHMDLYGPIRIQIRLNTTVRNIKTDNGTEFVNQTLKAYYEEVRISHQTSVARTLISLIRKHHNKTPYEFLHDQKPDLSYLRVFGALCYPTNDSKDFGKLKPKPDIGIFVGYAPTKKAFRIYNKRTRLIIETIHVNFDELSVMASEKFSSGPGPKLLTPGTISLGLVPNIPSFNSYLNPSLCVDLQVPAVITPEPAVLTGTPSSTTIDQDAPPTSTSQTTSERLSPVTPLGVEKANHDIEVLHMDNNPNVDFPILEPSSEESSTQ
ncbi:retrovirus-related pol polyprotein from transposon TNT 1-94, partial [Tanacetum coccineum]